MVIVTIWSLGITLYDIFKCDPVAADWNARLRVHAKCVTHESFVARVGIMAILTDFLFALLPVPILWGVQMSGRAKVTVSVILGMGVL